MLQWNLISYIHRNVIMLPYKKNPQSFLHRKDIIGYNYASRATECIKKLSYVKQCIAYNLYRPIYIYTTMVLMYIDLHECIQILKIVGFFAIIILVAHPSLHCL